MKEHQVSSNPGLALVANLESLGLANHIQDAKYLIKNFVSAARNADKKKVMAIASGRMRRGRKVRPSYGLSTKALAQEALTDVWRLIHIFNAQVRCYPCSSFKYLFLPPTGSYNRPFSIPRF
jgi:hypothetical protein